MTWWTEEGNVVAPKPVLDLLSEAAAMQRDHIAEEIELDDPELQFSTGVRVFDELEPKTRVFAIAFVLRHLSDSDLPSPDLYAWNEGTLWALFKTIEAQIAFEVEVRRTSEPEESRCHFRRLTLAALASYGHATKRYSHRSRNLRLWSDHLEMIYSRLFWDLDCLEDGIFNDMEPRQADALKDELGIHDEYFSEPPPLVRENDYVEADAYLKQFGE